jgi:hypothetical protein
MIFDVNVAMTWLLFLALFPITFYWTRNAWRILYLRDYSHVALKRGEPPPNPAKFAPFSAAINLIGAASRCIVIFGVVSASMAYGTWSAIAGSTIWMKLIFDFILSRHAVSASSNSSAVATASARALWRA